MILKKYKTVENYSKKKKKDIKSVSSLSRNYSKPAVYFTPKELVNCILNGVDYFLQNNFARPSNLAENDLVFLEPAAGLLTFPLNLIEYVKNSTDADSFRFWVSEVLLKKLYAFEIDPQIYKIAKKLWDEKIELLYTSIPVNIQKSSEKSSQKSNPRSNPESNLNSKLKYSFSTRKQKSGIFCESSIGEHPDDGGIISKLPLNPEDRLIIFGNPPYSVSSQLKSPWIQELIQDYKKELNRHGKKRILGLKAIQDDYVKFIRFGQWKLADQNNPGILAYVVNNYFLDGEIFRGMRASLKKAFDEIYIINLHGDPKKKPPDIKDQSVFDIQTGICIFFAIKSDLNGNTKMENNSCKIYYAESFGTKKEKFEYISQDFDKIPFVSVPEQLDHEFTPISEDLLHIVKEYNKFPYLPDIFIKNIIGVQSLHDTLVTHPDKSRLVQILKNFYDGTYSKLEFKDEKNQSWVKDNGVSYHDARDWKISYGLKGSFEKAKSNIIKWQWRGFDKWWVSYDEHLITKGSSSFSLMQFLLPHQDNIAIGVSRVSRKSSGEESVFITKNIAESHFIEGGSGIGDYLFPLKINAEISRSSDWEQPLDAKKYNFAPEFMQFWQERYGLDEEDCFYYIYGILWTPEYRTLYKPFLKKDFPHIPFSLSKDHTKKIAELGKILSELHTLSFSSEKINKWPTGSCKNYLIRNIYYYSKKNRIYFDKPNDKQMKVNGIQKDNSEKIFWIGDITQQMWGFSIGGVPQLSLWLKNRKFSSKIKKYSFNRAITKEELRNFLKICFSIKKTIELMNKLSIYYQN